MSHALLLEEVFAIVAALAALLALVLAVFAVRTRPTSAVNLLLAALLVGLSIGLTVSAIDPFFVEVEDLSEAEIARLQADPATGIHVIGWPEAVHGAMEDLYVDFVFPILGLLYVMFVAHALPRPATGVLRSRRGYMWVGGLVLLAWLISPMAEGDVGSLHRRIAELLMIAGALFGLGTAWRHRMVTSGLARKKADAYLMAFGALDVGIIAGHTSYLFEDFRGTGDPRAMGYAIGDAFVHTGTLWFIVFLAIGIMRAQVLDFDVKVREGIGRATIVGAILVAYFVASEIVEDIVSARMGMAAGLATAAATLLLARPLRKLGDKIGVAAVGDARPLDERSHESHRRLFEEQVELMLEDGGLSEKETRLLEAMRERLGLDQSEVDDIIRQASS